VLHYAHLRIECKTDISPKAESSVDSPTGRGDVIGVLQARQPARVTVYERPLL
jgi:hypothetical protein